MEEQLEALLPCDFALCDALLEETQKLFRVKGIIFSSGRKKSVDAQKKAIETGDEAGAWVKEFALPAETQAFYLQINSRDEAVERGKEIGEQIAQIQGRLQTFLQNNSDLEAEIAKKIKTFASTHLTKARKYLLNGLAKELNKDMDTANSIEEVREAVGKRYSSFLKREIFDRIIEPLYEGIKKSVQEADTEGEEAYRAVLRELNSFFSGLGVTTITVAVGEKMPPDVPYGFSEESTSAKYTTTDLSEKDIVREIRRYAYVFQEEKGSENRVVVDGEVIVAVYRPGGAA